jgi:hypothetical protein
MPRQRFDGVVQFAQQQQKKRQRIQPVIQVLAGSTAAITLRSRTFSEFAWETIAQSCWAGLRISSAIDAQTKAHRLPSCIGMPGACQ